MIANSPSSYVAICVRASGGNNARHGGIIDRGLCDSFRGKLMIDRLHLVRIVRRVLGLLKGRLQLLPFLHHFHFCMQSRTKTSLD